MSIHSSTDDDSSSAPSKSSSSSSSSNASSDFMVSSDTMSLSNTSDTSDSSLGTGVSSDDGRSNSSDGASDVPRDDDGGGAHRGVLLRFSAGQAAPDRIPDNLAPARLDKDGMVANEGVQLEVIGDVEPPRADAVDSSAEHLDQLVIPIHTNRMIPMLPQYALVTKYSWPHPVVRTDAEMDAAWDALNGLVERRGALMMFRNTRKGCQVVPAVHALALLAFAVLVALCYHGTVMENEAVWRLSTAAVNIFLIVPLALVVLTFICFIFPDITRTRKRRAQTICFFVVPYVVTYVIQWGCFERALDWWENNLGTVQIVVAFISQVGLVNFNVGMTEWARLVWHKEKREHYPTEFIPSCSYQCRTQSGLAHTIFVLEVALLVFCNCLSFFGIIPSYVGRFVVIVVFLPLVGFLVYKKSRQNLNTWSGGFGTLFGVSGQVSMYALGMVVFPLVSMLGGGLAVNVATMLAFMAVFALLFAVMQAFLHSGTENYHAPQYLYLGQVSFHGFLCTLTCLSPTEAQFWTMALIHWACNALTSTGALSELVYLCRRSPRTCGKDRRLDKELRLQRIQYYFMLHLQGRFADLLNSVLFPVMIVVDAAFSPADCSLSCGMDQGTRLLDVELHFLAYIVADIVLLLLCLLVHSVRFTRLSVGDPIVATKLTANGAESSRNGKLNSSVTKPKITARHVFRTWHALWHSFILHFNRYVIYFFFSTLLLITYVPFNYVWYMTPNPRWLVSSSSDTSSTSTSLSQ